MKYLQGCDTIYTTWNVLYTAGGPFLRSYSVSISIRRRQGWGGMDKVRIMISVFRSWPKKYQDMVHFWQDSCISPYMSVYIMYSVWNRRYTGRFVDGVQTVRSAFGKTRLVWFIISLRTTFYVLNLQVIHILIHQSPLAFLQAGWKIFKLYNVVCN